MEINFTKYRIDLKYSFGISRSSNLWYDVAFVYIKDNGIVGRGEAAPSKRYGESINDIFDVLKSGITLPKNNYDKDLLWKHIKPQLRNIKSLEAAFNMAIWDWWGQKKKKPIYQLLKINANKLPKTSFTIAIGELDEIGKKIEESEPYSILKVKLGTPKNDKNIITEIRKYTDKTIRVDANEGWDLDIAINMSKWLADRNVEFIEQPFPASKMDQTAIFKKKSPLDVFADENSINSSDIPNLSGFFDGINIKLMKCGSIEEGYKMIRFARKFKLKIMLGCMVESSVGITAASHLAGCVDYVDLDGNLLISNDPYVGVKVVDGSLKLSSKNGLGVKLNKEKKELL